MENQAPRPRAAVFDLDGLMFNTEELYHLVGHEILRRRGKVFDAELRGQMMGQPGRAAFQVMIDWHGLADSIEELQRESRELFRPILEERLSPLPGLLPLLEALEANSFPKAIATSSGREFAHRALDRFDLRVRFEFVLTGEDITHGKPAPDIYLLAARKLGVEPGDVLVLEDSQHGCRAAVAAGTFAVAVPGEHSQHHDFSGARFVADTLYDPRIYSALGMEAPGSLRAKE